MCVAFDQVQARPQERALRRDIVQIRVRDHLGDSVVTRHREERDHGLRREAVPAGRRCQSIADLNDATLRASLESSPPNGPSVAHSRDPVVAEWALYARRGAESQEHPERSEVPPKG